MVFTLAEDFHIEADIKPVNLEIGFADM